MYLEPLRVLRKVSLGVPTPYIYHVYRLWSSSPPCRAKKLPTYYKPSVISRNQIDALVGSNPSNYYITADLAGTLRRLGFQSVHTVVKLVNQHRRELQQNKCAPNAAVRMAATSQQWQRVYKSTLNSLEAKLLQDPNILRQIFHAFGKADLHFQNIKKMAHLGIYALQVAFDNGDEDAAIDTALAEVKSSGGLRQKTYDYIKKMALARADWRAMTIYLWHMLQSAQKKQVTEENYLLAKDLYAMLEPSQKQDKTLPFLRSFELPWKLLHDAADHYLYHLEEGGESDAVQEDLDMALREGVSKWSDPRAAEMILNQLGEVEKHSPRWISLITQSAMGGNSDSCFALAMYHLEKDGWYPKPSATKAKSWIGVEWLALSAALSTSDARTMVRRYLALAHILRENGHGKEGYAWLPTAKANVFDAGLDPNLEMVKYLDGFQQHWFDDKVIVTTSHEFIQPAEDNR
ncbi:hypothetical protein ABEF95_014301 [Exophiala dermatitidis]|uniref:Uncharacterized protein n=1 Tax=Exophiala dermatitidis (strain ATCC 34100 / CBS 525.76 / NIH/UT8656) TaxID=858893 RepID=H6C227_EXODN|nr:uncharacterized protein HMPREF1120_05877 [Exophiala dermatitidis NIH/UT8656]EHY57853.1 hypothetical protein HMPREF1120_05877 [Exophiala dermatitidis NIH/UT8656]